MRCSYCQRSFTRPEHLKRHVRFHTGEKPYECELCQKTYARSDVLTRHTRLSHPGTHPKNTSSQKMSEDSCVDDARPAVCSSMEPTVPNITQAAINIDVPSLQNVDESRNDGLNNINNHSLNVDRADASMTNNVNPVFVDTDFPFTFDHEIPITQDLIDEWVATTLPVVAEPRSSAITSTGNGVLTSSGDQEIHTERVRAVQQAWPRKNASTVIKLVHGSWRHAIAHPHSNLFSTQSEHSTPSAQPIGEKILPCLKVGESCRARLVKEFCATLLPAEQYTGGITAPNSPRIVNAPDQDFQVEGLSPQTPRMTFPSTETLTLSIDFFFRRVHPALPFIHKPTFDVDNTPSPLLLAICLLGLHRLQPSGARDFVRNYTGKLMRHCRIDLTYKALGKAGAHYLITSLATALLVLYLCLELHETVDIHQAHMLAIQTLFIADRHGLFRAKEGESFDASVFWHADQDKSWMAWARVESLKNLVLCLILVDSAYTRLLDLAAIISLDRVEVVLPCDKKLFEARDSTTFWSISRSWPIISTFVDLAAVQKELLSNNEFAIRVELAVLSLNEAAARHRLLQNSSIMPAAQYVPVVVYRTCINASIMTQNLELLVETCGRSPLCQSPVASLVWNFLCLAVNADVARVHVACGKDGMAASQQAQLELTRWAATINARKAVLHASQIYNISVHCRLAYDRTLIHESMLSTAAMVQAAYAMLRPRTNDSATICVDLAQEIDWTRLKAADSSTGVNCNSVGRASEQTVQQTADGRHDDLERFLKEGGSFSLGGECFERSTRSARDILLIYAQLLDELPTRSTSSEHSRLLRSVADYVG